MITVKPIEDNIRKEQLLSHYGCSAADSTILVMEDGVYERICSDRCNTRKIANTRYLSDERLSRGSKPKINYTLIFLCVLRHRMEPITVRIKWKIAWRLHPFCFKGFVLENGTCTISISKIVRVCNPHHT